MSEDIQVVGVYSVAGNKDVHLVEMIFPQSPSAVDVGRITQECPGIPRDNWQVAYDEHYLNAAGNQVIGSFYSLPTHDAVSTRVVFFLYFINFHLPLSSQWGQHPLPPETPMPERLQSIISFEDSD